MAMRVPGRSRRSTARVVRHDQENTTIARVAPRNVSIRPGVAQGAALAGATKAPDAVSVATVTSTMAALRMFPPPSTSVPLPDRHLPPPA